MAILIDGGFFLKRLPKIVGEDRRDSAEKVAGIIKLMCRNHIRYLTKCPKGQWQDHVYRIFFYDAVPYDGKAHHPFENRSVDFSKTGTALFRGELFDRLRKQRKVALRLGKVTREGDWSPPAEKIRRILATRDWLAGIDLSGLEDGGNLALSKVQVEQAKSLQRKWAEIRNEDVTLGLRQKGVDMRIGLDIASITLKRQADTIILVSGDSDFVPAAKLARREGVEFILDPLWQSVNDDLFEHIDGLQSGLWKPGTQPPAAVVKAVEAEDDNGTDD
ncbi:NYN domain-containing protein [Rhizobium sp. CBN3]|uniref:NYN domain-containing protein n=1 Tax=Rhizobium sp. CBN3 TaxID=3058045 RepID=UPI002672EB82|nr:NYN domain-containing protein [Rhizobium sp. CBN3]MDO3434523.1 NYN domain-containing protein [Rhizobium sp. CBN3]